jgi:RNA 2',3'-cyclic 3'-phosphodiesterase
MAMHRTFLAVAFSDGFRQQIGYYIDAIRPSFAGCRLSWVDPGNFHLTLHFFGDIDDSGISALKDKFSTFAGSIAPPRFEIAGLAYLPSARNPHVLCLDLAIEPRNALAPIIAEAKSLAAGLGASDEDRSWRAHLTLARIKEGRMPSLASLPPPPRSEYWPESFELMESFLSRNTARYAIAGSFAFSRRYP